jgi:hypothetical protein
MWNEYTVGMPIWASRSLTTPVDLSLRARDGLEPAMQTAQRVVVGLGSAAAIRGLALARNISTRW